MAMSAAHIYRNARTVLKQHELVQIPCPDNRHRYNDVLIYHEDHPFTGYGEKFYNILLQTKDEIEKSLLRSNNKHIL